MSKRAPETILQFGTGKFLRCFVDLFVHELNAKGQDRGGVVLVQSTGSERAEEFNRQCGRYHAAIRGQRQGERIDRTVEVASVARALAASSQWDEVLAVGRSDSLQLIVSNTTEAGYALQPGDSPTDGAPQSFPAKLLLVLKARFEARLPGVTVLPCELLERNADRLLDLVLDLTRLWELDDSLVEWLQHECCWSSTLVDRIVSAPSPGDPRAATDPLFAVAEPFALWLIEGTAPIPCGLVEHPAIEQVPRLEPYYLRKVRILNGAHTALVAKAMPLGFETVRDAVTDSDVGSWLRSLLFEEIVPVLEGRTESPDEFAEETLQRFANPFLDHRLADIALHHSVKLETRLAPTHAEYRERFGRVPKLLDEILSDAGS